MNQNETVLELNEYELHNIIANLTNVGLEGDHVTEIKLKLTNPELLSPTFIGEWEHKMNNLLKQFMELDAQYHAQAEHTCGN